MSESSRFLPGIPTAPGVNRVLLTAEDISRDLNKINFGGQKPSAVRRFEALADLTKKRHLALALGSKSLESLRLNNQQETWGGLVLTAQEMVGGYLEDIDFIDGEFTFEDDARSARQEVCRASDGGVATAGAILEVVPRRLACRRFDYPNKEIGDIWALRTKGMIIEWLGVHHKVDTRLAFALSVDKPKNKNVFDGLRLNSDLFAIDDAARSIKLDAACVPGLKARDGRHPLYAQPPVTALFGCPARKMIPDIYDQMRVAATELGLFEKTYWNERKRLGYYDAR